MKFHMHARLVITQKELIHCQRNRFSMETNGLGGNGETLDPSDIYGSEINTS